MAATSVDVEEMPARLAEMLDRVAQGETITITRAGLPIALLAPEPERRRDQIEKAIAEIKELRRTGPTMDADSFDALIDEARR